MVDEEPRASSGSSDEFGDDDFDSEMVEALDISPTVGEQPALITSYATVPTEPIGPLPQPQPPEVATSKEAGSDDEFGMDDEEDFAADLEHVASLYDIRDLESPIEDHAPTAASDYVATDNAVSAPVINLVDEDEDEFGEDIDVDEFAAAEVAATQAPENTVGRRDLPMIMERC